MREIALIAETLAEIHTDVRAAVSGVRELSERFVAFESTYSAHKEICSKTFGDPIIELKTRLSVVEDDLEQDSINRKIENQKISQSIAAATRRASMIKAIASAIAAIVGAGAITAILKLF